jgi:hypothetical protein
MFDRLALPAESQQLPYMYVQYLDPHQCHTQDALCHTPRFPFVLALRCVRNEYKPWSE